MRVIERKGQHGQRVSVVLVYPKPTKRPSAKHNEPNVEVYDSMPLAAMRAGALAGQRRRADLFVNVLLRRAVRRPERTRR